MKQWWYSLSEVSVVEIDYEQLQHPCCEHMCRCQSNDINGILFVFWNWLHFLKKVLGFIHFCPEWRSSVDMIYMVTLKIIPKWQIWCMVRNLEKSRVILCAQSLTVNRYFLQDVVNFQYVPINSSNQFSMSCQP